MNDKLQLKREIRRLKASIDYADTRIYRLGDWINACGEDNYEGEAEENERLFEMYNDSIDNDTRLIATLKAQLKEMN
jgi:hypothetical protein